MSKKTNYGNPYNCEQLAAFIEDKVWVAEIKQLQYKNGSYVTSILEYLDDNPCLIEHIVEFINSQNPEVEEEENIEE